MDNGTEPDQRVAGLAGNGSGEYNTNGFVNIFAVTNTIGTVTNYLNAGAATNLPSRYYRVRIVP